MQSSKLSATETEDEAEESEKKGADDELRPQLGMSSARRWIAVILVIFVLAPFFLKCREPKEADVLNPE